MALASAKQLRSELAEFLIMNGQVIAMILTPLVTLGLGLLGGTFFERRRAVEPGRVELLRDELKRIEATRSHLVAIKNDASDRVRVRRISQAYSGNEPRIEKTDIDPRSLCKSIRDILEHWRVFMPKQLVAEIELARKGDLDFEHIASLSEKIDAVLIDRSKRIRRKMNL